MNFFKKLFAKKSYDIADLIRDVGIGYPVKSGVRVGRLQALQVATLFACLRVLGEGVAQVPFKVMRKQGRGIEVANDHALHDLIAHQPNDWMTSFELREMMVWHSALCGAGYCFISRDTQGSPLELIPLAAGSVTVRQSENYDVTYRVSGPSGSSKDFPASSIWAVRGPSWNGYEGLEVLKLAREALGLSIAAEEHHARVHNGGLAPSGVYSVEGNLTAVQQQQLTKYLVDEYGGLSNVSKPLVIDRSAKFTPFAFKGVDIQHLETRNHQIGEVCRFMRVMPIMVGYADKSMTYASAEQLFLAHLVHTLMPWYTRLEQSANISLLTRAERKAGYYTKFHERGLLRGAMKDEGDYLAKLTERGILTRNEARELMDRNPLDGLDEPLTPINLTGDAGAPQERE